MSDDVPQAPEGAAPESPAFESGEAGTRAAAQDLGQRRAEGKLAVPETQQPEPEPRKVALPGEEPLSARQAGHKLSQLRQSEAARARQYQAAASAAIDAVDRRAAAAGPHEQAHAAAFKAAATELTQSFPDVTTPADVEKLRLQSPGRYARYAELDAAVRSVPDGQQSDPDLEAQRAAAATEASRQAAAFAQAETGRITAVSDEGRRLAVLEQQQAAWVQAKANEFNARYADVNINSADALTQLQQADPAKWAAIQRDYAALTQDARHLQQVSQDLQQVQAAESEVRKARNARIAAENERYLVEELHPEWKDPAKYKEAQDEVASALRHVKLDGAEGEALRRGQEGISLLDWRTLEIIRLAGKQLQGEARRKQIEAGQRNGKQLPPVVRPGVADPGRGRGDRVADLERRFASASGQRQMRLGAELLAARRERQ